MNSFAMKLMVFAILVVGAASVPLTVPELIRMNGYVCEEHFVTTEDGYILSLHRIPHGKNRVWGGKFGRRGPLMMQHGLLASSASWVLNVTHEAPAYLFADEGYDVWLTNIRGNAYSRNHTRLSPEKKEFWEFSWDEMAKYDLPTFIDYILNETKQKQLDYIGHSMGTTIFFAGMSIKPEYNAKIKSMFALAPIGTVSFIETSIRYISYFEKELNFFADLFGDYEIGAQGSPHMKYLKYLCKKHLSETSLICRSVLFMIIGYDPSEFENDWMPAIMDELVSGTSLNTIQHYAQEYREGRFQHFDFGAYKNEKKYAQIAPPEYTLHQVKAPVHLLWSMNDYLADDRDIQYLVKYLGNVKSKYVIPYKKFNHLDFLWAKDAKMLVYDPILEVMGNY